MSLHTSRSVQGAKYESRQEPLLPQSCPPALKVWAEMQSSSILGRCAAKRKVRPVERSIMLYIEIGFLFLTVWLTIINTVRLFRGSSMTTINLFLQAVGIVGFIVCKWYF